MPRHQVPVLYLVATLREPQGVTAGTAADVRDDGRRRREISEHDLRCPQKFQPAAALGQPVPLAMALVVLEYVPVLGAVAHYYLPLTRGLRDPPASCARSRMKHFRQFFRPSGSARLIWIRRVRRTRLTRRIGQPCGISSG